MSTLMSHKTLLFATCLCLLILISGFEESAGVNTNANSNVPTPKKISSTRISQSNNNSRQRKIVNQPKSISAKVKDVIKDNVLISKNEKRDISSVNINGSVNASANASANGTENAIANQTKPTLLLGNDSISVKLNGKQINESISKDPTTLSYALSLISDNNTTESVNDSNNVSSLVTFNEATTPGNTIKVEEDVKVNVSHHDINNGTVNARFDNNLGNETSGDTPNIKLSLSTKKYPTRKTPIGSTKRPNSLSFTPTVIYSDENSSSTHNPINMVNPNPRTPTINLSSINRDLEIQNEDNPLDQEKNNQAHQTDLTQCDLQGEITCKPAFMPICYGSGEIDCGENEHEGEDDIHSDSSQNHVTTTHATNVNYNYNSKRIKRFLNESETNYNNNNELSASRDLNVAEDVINSIINSPKKTLCAISPSLICIPHPIRGKDCLGKGICQLQLSSEKIHGPIEFWKVGLVAGLAAVGGVIFIFVVVIAYVSYNKLKVRPDSESNNGYSSNGNTQSDCTRV